MDAFVEMAEQQPGLSAVIVGDYNNESVAYEEATLEMLKWADIGGDQATCCGSRASRARRIDWCIANQSFQRRIVKELEVDWTYQFEPHAAQVFWFHGGQAPNHHEWQAREMRSWPDQPGWSYEYHGRQVWACLEAAWGRAANDVDQMWAIVEEAHQLVAAQLEGVQPQAIQEGRVVTRADEPRWVYQGHAHNWRSNQLKRRLEHIRQLQKLTGKTSANARIQRSQIAKRCRTNLKSPGLHAIQGKLHDPLILRREESRLMRELEEAKQAESKARSDRYHAWAVDQRAKHLRQAYQTVRRTGRREFLTGSIAGQVSECDEAWWNYWSAEDYDQAALQEICGQLQHLPRMQEPKPPQWQQLQRIIRRMSRRKASGADGWQVSALKKWPAVFWEKVAQVLEVVQRKGQWPQQLREAHVAMLEKSGPVNGLQARPITLLSVVYRVWGKAQVNHWRRWSQQAQMQLLAVDAESTELQAAAFSLEVAIGRLEHREIGGLAADFSKCYDTLRLPVLQAILDAAGVHTALSRPLLDMWASPRRIVVGKACGRRSEPKSGLPAGCPLATFVLSVVSECWRRQARMCPEPVVARTWVDDVVAYGLNRRAAEASVTNAVRLLNQLEAIGLKVNRAKTGIIASSRDLAATLQRRCADYAGCEGPVKDLGVHQGTDGAARTAAHGRWRPAIERLGKIAKLPLPMELLGRMSAAAALTTGAYGAGQRAHAKHVLQTVRKWVRHAVWRGGPAADMRVLWATGELTWRSDPVRVVAVRASNIVGQLIEAGAVTAEAGRELWVSQQQQNPIGALKEYLSRIGVVSSWDRWASQQDELLHPFAAKPEDRRQFILQATTKWDLGNCPVTRKYCNQPGEQIECRTFRLRIKKLRLPKDQAAALRGVQCGDCKAAKWKGGPGLCRCGQREDLHHRWLKCPISAAWRQQHLQGYSERQMLNSLPASTTALGLPTTPSELQGWHVDRAATLTGEAPAGGRYYTDGSCYQPRVPELRSAGWAVAFQATSSLARPRWVTCRGAVPGRQTIGRAELYAVVVVLERGQPGQIVSDCKSVVNGCERILDGKWSRAKCNQDLWERVERALQEPGWAFLWMPSHLSQAEVQKLGFTSSDWQGNQQADEAAKQGAKQNQPPKELRERFLRHLEMEAVMMKLIAKTQTRLLSRRTRRPKGEAAVKARKRKAPADLRLGRKRGRKAELAQPGGFGDLEARLCPVPGEEGHQLHVELAGPWPEPGKWPARKGGALLVNAKCGRCNKRAGDTSRLLQLARTGCRSQEQWARAHHNPLQQGKKQTCQRCQLCRPGHENLGQKRCPIWLCQGPNGTLERQTLEYARCWQLVQEMHKYNKVRQQPAQAEEIAPARERQPQVAVGGPQGSAQLRAEYHAHKCWQIGKLEFCVDCFAKRPRYKAAEWRASPCDGSEPAHAMGAAMRNIIWMTQKDQRHALTGRRAELVQAARPKGTLLPDVPRAPRRVWTRQARLVQDCPATTVLKEPASRFW